MHSVHRGTAPKELAVIAKKYTPKWVAFYERGIGKKPKDDKWLEFEPILREQFDALCGYCEDTCKEEIDHFQPKSQFPKEVYVWGNWVYSCHTCNHSKREQWYVGGYIDPCAADSADKPERFFRFDTTTGELLPADGLSGDEFTRAVKTRDALKLNAFHHIKKRVFRLKVIGKALDSMKDDEERAAFVALVTARNAEFSSIVRTLLAERGIALSARVSD